MDKLNKERTERKISHVHTIDALKIGSVLRELREAKKMTQMQVSEELEISPVHYAKIEEGAHGMSMKLLFRIMNFYEVDANTVLCIRPAEVA